MSNCLINCSAIEMFCLTRIFTNIVTASLCNNLKLTNDSKDTQRNAIKNCHSSLSCCTIIYRRQHCELQIASEFTAKRKFAFYYWSSKCFANGLLASI